MSKSYPNLNVENILSTYQLHVSDDVLVDRIVSNDIFVASDLVAADATIITGTVLDTLNTNNLTVSSDFQAIIPYVGLYDDSSASVTTVSVINDWYHLQAVPTVSYSNDGLTVTGVGTVTNTSSRTRVFKNDGIISVSAGSNETIAVATAVNGVILPCSIQNVVTKTAGDSAALPFQCLAQLTQGDYLDIYVRNESSTNNITLDHLNFIVVALD